MTDLEANRMRRFLPAFIFCLGFVAPAVAADLAIAVANE
jgi:hypothetical protein